MKRNKFALYIKILIILFIPTILFSSEPYRQQCIQFTSLSGDFFTAGIPFYVTATCSIPHARLGNLNLDDYKISALVYELKHDHALQRLYFGTVVNDPEESVGYYTKHLGKPQQEMYPMDLEWDTKYEFTFYFTKVTYYYLVDEENESEYWYPTHDVEIMVGLTPRSAVGLPVFNMAITNSIKIFRGHGELKNDAEFVGGQSFIFSPLSGGVFDLPIELHLYNGRRHTLSVFTDSDNSLKLPIVDEIVDYYTDPYNPSSSRIPFKVGWPLNGYYNFYINLDSECVDTLQVHFSTPPYIKTTLPVEYDYYEGCDMSNYFPAAGKAFELAGINLDFQPDETEMPLIREYYTGADLSYSGDMIAENGVVAKSMDKYYLLQHKKPSSKAYCAAIRKCGKLTPYGDIGSVLFDPVTGKLLDDVGSTGHANVGPNGGVFCYIERVNPQATSHCIAHELGHQIGVVYDDPDQCKNPLTGQWYSPFCLMHLNSEVEYLNKKVTIRTWTHSFFCDGMLKKLRDEKLLFK